MPRNTNDRMMRSNQRDMRPNENRREDHRRVENIRIDSQRGFRSDDHRMENNHIRKDDHYGRQPNRVNERVQNAYIPNRNSKEIRETRFETDQYGPARGVE